QRLGGDAVAAATDLLVVGEAVAVGHVRQRLLLAVHQTQIFHGVFSAVVTRPRPACGTSRSPRSWGNRRARSTGAPRSRRRRRRSTDWGSAWSTRSLPRAT